MPLQLTYHLGEVLTPELLSQHDELIRNFLVFEHIAFDPDNLAGTEITERKIRELLEEIALAQDGDSNS
jgi:hypothetical protein